MRSVSRRTCLLIAKALELNYPSTLENAWNEGEESVSFLHRKYLQTTENSKRSRSPTFSLFLECNVSGLRNAEIIYTFVISENMQKRRLNSRAHQLHEPRRSQRGRFRPRRETLDVEFRFLDTFISDFN